MTRISQQSPLPKPAQGPVAVKLVTAKAPSGVVTNQGAALQAIGAHSAKPTAVALIQGRLSVVDPGQQRITIHKPGTEDVARKWPQERNHPARRPELN